ncbi:MAG: hypothetical protein AAF296_06930 [Pseudomonadota bacterium]
MKKTQLLDELLVKEKLQSNETKNRNLLYNELLKNPTYVNLVKDVSDINSEKSDDVLDRIIDNYFVDLAWLEQILFESFSLSNTMHLYSSPFPAMIGKVNKGLQIYADRNVSISIQSLDYHMVKSHKAEEKSDSSIFFSCHDQRFIFFPSKSIEISFWQTDKFDDGTDLRNKSRCRLSETKTITERAVFRIKGASESFTIDAVLAPCHFVQIVRFDEASSFSLEYSFRSRMIVRATAESQKPLLTLLAAEYLSNIEDLSEVEKDTIFEAMSSHSAHYVRWEAAKFSSKQRQIFATVAYLKSLVKNETNAQVRDTAAKYLQKINGYESTTH